MDERITEMLVNLYNNKIRHLPLEYTLAFFDCVKIPERKEA